MNGRLAVAIGAAVLLLGVAAYLLMFLLGDPGTDRPVDRERSDERATADQPIADVADREAGDDERVPSTPADRAVDRNEPGPDESIEPAPAEWVLRGSVVVAEGMSAEVGEARVAAVAVLLPLADVPGAIRNHPRNLYRNRPPADAATVSPDGRFEVRTSAAEPADPMTHRWIVWACVFPSEANTVVCRSEYRLLAPQLAPQGERIVDVGTAEIGQTAVPIAGRVIDDETEEPLAGVTVRARVYMRVETAFTLRPETITDADGRFVLEGLPPLESWLSLEATKEGFAEGGVGLNPPPSGQNRLPIVVRMSRLGDASLRIHGRDGVLADTVIAAEGPYAGLLTDADGIATIPLAQAQAEPMLPIRVEGYVPKDVSLSRATSERTPYSVSLTPAEEAQHSIRLRLVYPSGEPLDLREFPANIAMLRSRHGWREPMYRGGPEDAGVIRFEMVSNYLTASTIRIANTRVQEFLLEFDIQQAETDLGDVVVHPPREPVVVRLLDRATGDPIRGANVATRGISRGSYSFTRGGGGGGGSGMSGPVAAVEVAPGLYRFGDRNLGHDLEIRASHPDYATETVRVPPDPPAADSESGTHVVVIEMGRGATVTVFAPDADQDADVVFAPSDPNSMTSDRRVEIGVAADRIPAGRYHVYVYRGRDGPNQAVVTLRDGEETTLTLGSATHRPLQVWVQYADGSPAAGVGVSLYEGTAESITNAEGLAEVPIPVELRAPVISVQLGAGAPSQYRLTGYPIETHITLPAAAGPVGALELAVRRTPTGYVGAEAIVSADLPGDSRVVWRRVPLDRDRVRLDELPAGEYRVEIVVPFGPERTMEATITAGETVSLSVEVAQFVQVVLTINRPAGVPDDAASSLTLYPKDPRVEHSRPIAGGPAGEPMVVPCGVYWAQVAVSHDGVVYRWPVQQIQVPAPIGHVPADAESAPDAGSVSIIGPVSEERR